MSEFEKAFLKAQQAMRAAKKDSENPFFKSKYTDYATLVATVKAPLNDNGLSFRHTSRFENDRYMVGTVLIHADTGARSEVFEFPTKIGSPQETGSSVSYSKRYTLAALLGVASDDDDDGNAASGKNAQLTKDKEIDSGASREKQLRTKAVFPAAGGLSEKQQNLVFALSKKAGWTMNEVAEYISVKYGLTDWRSMGREALDDLLNAFKAGGAARGHIDGFLLSQGADIPPPNDEDIPL